MLNILTKSWRGTDVLRTPKRVQSICDFSGRRSIQYNKYFLNKISGRFIRNQDGRSGRPG
jgi:hypothetical protein